MGESTTFGLVLRQHRLAANLSQEELAARSQLSAKGIAVLERGHRRAPRPSTVAMLANGLGLSAGELSAFIAAANRERASAEHVQLETPQVALSPQGIRSTCAYP